VPLATLSSPVRVFVYYVDVTRRFSPAFTFIYPSTPLGHLEMFARAVRSLRPVLSRAAHSTAHDSHHSAVPAYFLLAKALNLPKDVIAKNQEIVEKGISAGKLDVSQLAPEFKAYFEAVQKTSPRDPWGASKFPAGTVPGSVLPMPYHVQHQIDLEAVQSRTFLQNPLWYMMNMPKGARHALIVFSLIVAITFALDVAIVGLHPLPKELMDNFKDLDRKEKAFSLAPYGTRWRDIE